MKLHDAHVLAFVRIWSERFGYAPSVVDVARGFLLDDGPTRARIRRLALVALVTWTPGLGRTLHLTSAGRDLACDVGRPVRVVRAVGRAGRRHTARMRRGSCLLRAPRRGRPQ